MKIYSIVSPSHEPLLEGWHKTISREPMARPHILKIPVESDGDYRNKQWNEILTIHEHLTTGLIHDNIGEVIGIIGADVRFIRPFVMDVLERIEDKDILMQDEDATRRYYNPDVMFVRCSIKLLKAWIVYLQVLSLWNGHMDHQNRLMLFAFHNLRLDFLPIRYAATLNGGKFDEDMRLYHANNLHAPKCVAQKLEALREYE